MFRTIPHWGANEKRSVSIGVTEPTVAPKAEIRDFYEEGGRRVLAPAIAAPRRRFYAQKTGQGAYLGLILFHTKFEKKSRGLTDVRHKITY